MNCAHIVRRLPLDSILIDDNEDLKENWESRGGIFVHHTNTERTLRKLKEHGILLNDREVSRSDAMKGGAESLLQHFRLTPSFGLLCASQTGKDGSKQEPATNDETQESTQKKDEALYDMPPDTP
jgi:hypothetical protein